MEARETGHALVPLVRVSFSRGKVSVNCNGNGFYGSDQSSLFLGKVVKGVSGGFGRAGGDGNAVLDRAEKVSDHEEPFIMCKECGRVEGGMNETLCKGVFYMCRCACQDTAFLIVREVVCGEGGRVCDVVKLWVDANIRIGKANGGVDEGWVLGKTREGFKEREAGGLGGHSREEERGRCRGCFGLFRQCGRGYSVSEVDKDLDQLLFEGSRAQPIADGGGMKERRDANF